MVFYMEWENLEKPGFFGNKRDEIYRKYNEKYGKNNWRIAWQWSNTVVNNEFAYLLYEDAYYWDSHKRKDLWQELISIAKDVYDIDKSNVNSGLDYLIQECGSIHLQDIAIRRVISRKGWKFKGNELVQIRSHSAYFGEKLSPGKVPFHLTEMIVEPHLKGWWDNNSVEDFYQSNKILQIKKL